MGAGVIPRITLTCLAALAVAGCTSTPPRVWTAPDGSSLQLELDAVSGVDEEEGRVRYRLESGLTVSLQAIDRDARLPGTDRDPDNVAEALATRVELEGAGGELTATPCTVLSSAGARCVQGWMEHGGREHARSGAVFELGSQIVWLDVAGPRERADEVREAAAEVLRGARRVDS